MIPTAIDLDAAPTDLVFGWGVSGRLAGITASMGSRAAILCGRSFAGQPERVEALASSLRDRGVETAVLNQIRPNPDVEDVMSVLDAAGDADVFIAFGGGSVLDAGKVVAVAAAAGPPVELDGWLSGTRVEARSPRRRLVAVPTTAGTGSELSFGAIVSDRGRGWKGGIRGEGLAADVAVVDPSLTVTQTPRLTAATGFDVVTHAFESYVSARAHARSRMLSIVAITLVREHLPSVLADPADRDSRTAVSFASTMIGLNLRDVGTCLPHRMQYPIGGAVPEVSHPEALAWLYPPWLARVFEVRPTEVSDFLALLGVGRPTSAPDAGVRMRQWFDEIGLPSRPPASVRLDPEQLAARLEGNLAVDPIPGPEAAALEIYREL